MKNIQKSNYCRFLIVCILVLTGCIAMYSIEPEDPADSLPSSSSIEPTTTATSLAESRDSVDPESSEELYKRLHQNYRDFNEGVQPHD